MEWTVEVRSPVDGAGNSKIRLGLKSWQNEEVVWITSELQSLEEFKQKVHELQNGLLEALQRGEAYWQEKRKEGGSTQVQNTPEEIWEKMQEFEDEQEMSAYFNQLDEATRKMTAEYILSQVSMFKGKAPYFAQNYDFDTNMMS